MLFFDGAKIKHWKLKKLLTYNHLGSLYIDAMISFKCEKSVDCDHESNQLLMKGMVVILLRLVKQNLSG